MHHSDFIKIVTGSEVDKLPLFHLLDFDLVGNLIGGRERGQRWNRQLSFGCESQDLRCSCEGGLINWPSHKKSNIELTVLPLFANLSLLLSKLDTDYQFHASMQEGKERCINFA